MIGDIFDIQSRLRSLLPASWWPRSGVAITGIQDGADITVLPDSSDLTSTTPGPPILSAMLQAPSTALAFIYALIAYVKLQTRIMTATGGWLDLIANDFFGATFGRAPGQSDASFAAAIVAQIFLIRNTRQAISQLLTSLTGIAPTVFEPWRIPDSAALNQTLYYSTSGLRGSRNYPYVVFITVHVGTSGVTNAQVYAALESIRTAGVKYWVQILNP